MSQEFVFEFSGTKEDFLNKLGCFPNNNRQYCYFNDYIVKMVDDEIHFGVMRAGHSNGYWFIPTITQQDGKTEFRGVIKYVDTKNKPISGSDKKSFFKRCIEITGRILLYILVFPFALSVFLFVKVYEAFKRIKRKMLCQPTTKVNTKEDKLIDLMENHLGCVRK